MGTSMLQVMVESLLTMVGLPEEDGIYQLDCPLPILNIDSGTNHLVAFSSEQVPVY